MVLQIGVIGAGGMGREHITNLSSLDSVDVVLVADIIAASAESAAALVGATATTDPTQVISDAALDGIVIASPDETHADLAIAAIERGLPVLCEKPLAVTVADAERVTSAEQASGRALLQVGFMRHYDPAHRQAEAAIAELGNVHHLRGVHRNTNHDWLRTLDVVCSQSLIHDVHTARWLTGAEFTSVVAQVSSTGERIDHVVLLGAMTNGATVTLEFAEATYGYDVEVEVTCQDGMVIAAQPSQPQVRSGGSSHRHIGDDWFGRFREAYRLEALDWIAGLRAGHVNGPTAADGLAAQRVIAAAIESAHSGQRITLP